ncbi:MAG: hypothetical protein QW666_01775 [Candidatus Woesearchaeota archaeon]
MKKNKKLTEYEEIKDFVVANSVRKTIHAKKAKDGCQDKLLYEFQ